MSSQFTSQAFGKWILSGEHSVLRGGASLVLPLRSRFLEMTYTRPSSELAMPLRADFSGPNADEYQMIFWGVLEHACELLQIPRREFQGQLHLQCKLPLGAGLGASAAMCVLMARWFSFLKMIPATDEFSMAQRLEDLFHGKSSGVDIASASSGQPLEFKIGHDPKYFELTWRPLLYLSYCGHRGVTKECVEQVNRFGAASPRALQETDAQMQESVELCRAAMTNLQNSESERFALLSRAMNLAHQSFQSWGLTQGDVAEHIKMLRSSGAEAVKPTGSGGGGYILSLWQEPPPAHLQSTLLSCF